MGMTTVSEDSESWKTRRHSSPAGLSYLICHIRNLIVDGVENTGVLSGDRIDQALFNPVCYPFKQTAHNQPLTEQAGKQRDQRCTNQSDTSACHKLFYPQLGVKLCSMAGGGVQKIYMVFFKRTVPAGQVRQ